MDLPVTVTHTGKRLLSCVCKHHEDPAGVSRVAGLAVDESAIRFLQRCLLDIPEQPISCFYSKLISSSSHVPYSSWMDSATSRPLHISSIAYRQFETIEIVDISS